MLALCGIIVVSCQPTKETSAGMVRNLNPTEEPLQESPAYNKVEIVRLETSPSCLLGHINRIEMNDDYMFVAEFQKLYAFTREGKFIAQIGEKGEGPGEYITLSSFYVDNEKRQVTIIDSYKNKFINYDFNGKYLSSVSSPNVFQSCNYSLLTADNKLLNYNELNMRDTKPYSLLDMDKQEVNYYFSYHPITVGNYMYPFSWHPMARTGKDIDIIMPLCDTIYTYSSASSSFETKYVIEIPCKMAPKDKIRERTPSYSEDLWNLRDQGFFTGFSGIFETDTKVLLECNSGLGYFLFDKSSKTGNYYDMSSEKSKLGTLPFFHVIHAYRNAFIAWVQPGNLLNLKNMHDKKILESIKGLEEDDNPCLVLYELK